jgi:outer membrane immunogenic protein
MSWFVKKGTNMEKKKLALAAATLMAFQAYADDHQTWQGCYGGFSLTHANSSNQWTTNTFQGEVLNENAGSKDADDLSASVQVGCDLAETEHWVLGLKLSASGNDLEATHLYQGGTSDDNFLSYRTDDVYSLSARAGYKVSTNGLLYGQLGYVHSSHFYHDLEPGLPVFEFNKSLSRNGTQFGIGYEHKLGEHLSLYGEYNWVDYGKERTLLNDLSGFDIDDYVATFDQDLSMFHLGLNYRF